MSRILFEFFDDVPTPLYSRSSVIQSGSSTLSSRKALLFRSSNVQSGSHVHSQRVALFPRNTQVRAGDSVVSGRLLRLARSIVDHAGASEVVVIVTPSNEIFIIGPVRAVRQVSAAIRRQGTARATIY